MNAAFNGARFSNARLRFERDGERAFFSRRPGRFLVERDVRLQHCLFNAQFRNGGKESPVFLDDSRARGGRKGGGALQRFLKREEPLFFAGHLRASGDDRHGEERAPDFLSALRDEAVGFRGARVRAAGRVSRVGRRRARRYAGAARTAGLRDRGDRP